MKKFLTVIAFLLLAQWTEAATTHYTDGSLGSSCSGSTYSVANRNCSGSDGTGSTTIAGGIASLVAGDTLDIRAGTYAEGIDMYPQGMAALSGTSYSNATVIQAHGTEVVTIRGLGGGGIAPGAAIRYIVFKGDPVAKNFVIDCTNAGSSCVNLVSNSGTLDHIKLDGLDIKNLPNNADSGAIVVIGSNTGVGTDMWITNSKVHDQFGCHLQIVDGLHGDNHAFYIQSSNNIVENTEIYNIQGFGIHEYNEDPTPFMTGNIFRNNYVHDTGLNTSTVGAFQQCRQFVTWGIMTSRASGTQIYNNLLIHNFGGISAGALGTTASNAKIYSNTLYANGTGAPFSSNPACCFEAIQNSGANNEIRNNIVFGNAADQIFNNGTGTTVVTPNLVAVNPSFANAAGNNFHILSGSAARNVGANLGPPYNADKDNVSRPAAPTPWDDGAYQFSTGAAPFTVTIQSTNPASGATITLNPADNGGNSSCTTPCTTTWDSGSNIQLIAAASAGGNNFNNWSGGCTSQSSTICTITGLASNLTATASYQAPSNPDRTLSVTSSPSSVTIASSTDFLKITPFSKTVPDGTALVLKANAKSDCAMARWNLTEGTGTSVSDQCNGNTLTLSNTTWSGTDLVFNGTTSIGTAADSDYFHSLNEFSSAATVTPSATLTDFAAAVGKNYRWILYAGSPGSYCGGPVGVLETTTGEVAVCSATPLVSGVTYKLAFVVTPTNLKLYKDGTLLATTANTSNAFGTTDSTFTVTVGGTQYGEFFPGKIRNVNIAGRSWAQSDVNSYGAGTLSDGNAFVSWSGCTSGSVTTCNITMSQDKTATVNYVPPASNAPALIIGGP